MAAVVGPVAVEGGRLKGVRTADGVAASFKGLAYAAPPVGPLRWKPPQPVVPWSGVRSCEAFGPRSVQPDRPTNSIGYYGPEAESEDCLFLNVWTGAQSSDERRPVIVWFHGGAFYIGSGSLPPFNGEALARRGLVTVTVNYRLGRLGFLAHPDLTKESGHHASGNYGMLDMVAALRWVRQNIAAFGGDPNRVTIAGQSVGGMSTSCLMASPLAKGLFQRVIGQSGAAFGPVRESSVTGDSMQSLDHAEATGVEFARKLGAKSIAELRAKSARELQLFGHENADPSRVGRGAFDTYWVIVDGHFLPEGPYAIFEQGKQNDAPLLTGTAANEGAIVPAAPSLAAYVAQTREEFGPAADRFLELFPARDDAEAVEASRHAFAYRNFIWQNWMWARLQSRTGRSNVYYYRFNHVPPIPPGAVYAENAGDKLGAFHCAEIPYVFDNLATVRDWKWQPADHVLAEQLSSYWVNFATTGDPNGRGLPEWPTFNEKSEMTMNLEVDPKAAQVADRAALDFWDAFYAGQRARAGAPVSAVAG